jgi:hypothetical protein
LQFFSDKDLKEWSTAKCVHSRKLMWVKLVLRLLQLIVNRYKKYVRDTLHAFVSYLQLLDMPWRRGLAVSSPSATEETGAIGREIESRKGIGGL